MGEFFKGSKVLASYVGMPAAYAYKILYDSAEADGEKINSGQFSHDVWLYDFAIEISFTKIDPLDILDVLHKKGLLSFSLHEDGSISYTINTIFGLRG